MKGDSYVFSDIINISQIQNLMNLFFKATGIPVGIIDKDDNIQITSGWQDICLLYHRVHPETKNKCIKSDHSQDAYLKNNDFIAYRCYNGLWDVATPIIIENRQLATLFLGQFFFSDEKLDIEYFRNQAKLYGFDEREYLKSLDKVPRFTRNQVKQIMEYYIEFVNVLVDMGLNKLRQLKFEREEAEIKYQTLYNKTPVMMYSINTSGEIITVNDYWLTKMGYSKEEVIGKKSIDFLTEESKLKSIPVLEKFWNVGFIYNEGYQMIKKNGEVMDVLLSAHMELDSRGNPLHSLAFVFDITEQKQMEDELKRSKLEAEAANNAKNEFLTTMSHEIRTPLNAVLGFSELLEEQLENSEHKSYIEIVHSSGQVLLTLINDILDLATIESKNISIEYTKVHLKSFLNDLKQLFIVNAKRKNIDFFLEVDRRLPDFIYIDQMRLRQILFNIIGNAIKFTKKGYVKIKIESVPLEETYLLNDIIFRIEDSGVGISEMKIKDIFNPFANSNESQKGKQDGVGLGLAISKRLLDVMDGELYVKSEIGVGSLFEVRLKGIKSVVQTSQITSQNLNDYKDIKQLSGTILVADDVESNRKLVVESLLDSNIKVFEAENGEQVLELSRTYLPDLILLDLKMPILDGFKTVQILKSESKLKHIPVIAISASTSHAKDISKYGFAAYILKPIKIDELHRLIKNFLNITYFEEQEYQASSGIQVHDSKINRLIEVLENQLIPIWKELQTKQPIKKMNYFATQLTQLGKSYDFDILVQFGNSLSSSIKNYDVTKMLFLLNEFPNMILKIKSKPGDRL